MDKAQINNPKCFRFYSTEFNKSNKTGIYEQIGSVADVGCSAKLFCILFLPTAIIIECFYKLQYMKGWHK